MLADYTSYTGNFSVIAIQVCALFSYICIYMTMDDIVFGPCLSVG